MKRFIIHILLLIGIPLGLLIGTYVLLDPYRIVFPYSVSYFNEKPLAKTNREYLSIKQFENNCQTRIYDSFIIGSSRTCAFNSYQWQKYLNTDNNPYIFTSWRENMPGIHQKILYLDKMGVDIKNVLLVLDCGEQYTFNISKGDAPLTNHYYKLSGQTQLGYQMDYFKAFASKPSKWFTYIQDAKAKNKTIVFDTITNDSHLGNDTISMCPLSNMTIDRTNWEIRTLEDMLPPLINLEMENLLKEIQQIFMKHDTDCKIIICPNYFRWKINSQDFTNLSYIFGEDNIFDYSGEHPIASEDYHYNDVEHFNSNVAWRIIEDLYNNKNNESLP